MTCFIHRTLLFPIPALAKPQESACLMELPTIIQIRPVAPYIKMLFIAAMGSGMSFSRSISRRSISTVRLKDVIGTSFGPPWKGFSELSPILSIVWNTQEMITLTGTVSHMNPSPSF